jgi:hypothetical protein
MAADHPLDWGPRCKHGVILYPSMMDSTVVNLLLEICNRTDKSHGLHVTDRIGGMVVLFGGV